MTFNVYVTDPNGTPVMGLYISGNDMLNGETFVRSTDGNGYSNVAMLGTCKAGDPGSVTVLDPQLRYQGTVQYHTLATTVEVRITVVPFV
jgi:hypothetical protein